MGLGQKFIIFFFVIKKILRLPSNFLRWLRIVIIAWLRVLIGYNRKNDFLLNFTLIVTFIVFIA